MSIKNWPGGRISPTPPTPSGPYENSTASGVWTLDQVAYWRQQNLWPLAGNIAPDPNFEYVTMLLPGNGTNGAQNNTFLDSSSNNFSITRNGVTTQGTFSPYGSNWSNYFDGSSYFSNIGATSSFNFMHQSSALWTCECFVFVTSLSAALYLIDNTDGTSSQTGVNIYIGTDGKINLFITSGSGGGVGVCTGVSSSGIQANTWNHIVVTYDQSLSSNNAKFYINGASVGTATKGPNTPSAGNASQTMRIGAVPGAPSNNFRGYISNLRITNSIVYSSAFTPPTTPLTAITNTSLLTCQSNRFIDNSSNAFAITVNGSPSVQRFSPLNTTTSYAAGTIGGSGYFDGASWLDNPSSSTAYAFGTGDFTIEGFAYRDVAGTSDAGLFALSNGLRIVRFSSSTIRFILGATTIGETVPSIGQWFHWAAVRRSGTMYLYINGVSTFSSANSTNVTGSISSTIGRASTSSLTNFYTGFLSSIRVTKGAALYTANFTPPSTPLTTTVSGGTVELLTNFTNAGIIDNAMMNDLYTENTVQISTAQSKFGSGSISFPANGDFTWAYRSPQSQLANNFTIELFAYPTLAAGFFFCVGDINPGGAEQGISVSWQSSGTAFRLDSNGGAKISSSTVPTVNTWSHIAVVRNSGVVTLYLNGVSLGTWSSSATFLGNVYIGTQVQSGGFNGYFRGFIDEFRITNGIARYTANFTPPTAAFPTFGG